MGLKFKWEEKKMAKKLYDENGNVVKGAKVKKPFYKRWWFILLVVLVIGGALAGGDEDTTSEEVTAEEPDTEVVADADEETTEEVVEEEPEEVVELTSEEKIKEAADDIYGNNLVEVEYIDATNHYNVYTNTAGLSANMDRKSAYFNATNFLEKIKDVDFDSVYIEYRTVFVDDYGNEEEREGITYDITKETIDKINFDSFLAEKLPSVADSYWQHPAFN